jgi:DNA-binding transcriptional ArsR family regulator
LQANIELLSSITHPTRVHALSVLAERSATAKELAAELECPVRHVQAHLRKLEELGFVSSTTAKSANGRSSEKRYRTAKKAWFDRRSWKRIDPEDRPGVTAAVMGLIEKDLAEAIAAGTLDGEENHISRTPMLVDKQGYGELVSFLSEVLEGLLQLREKVEERLDDDAETIATVVHLLQVDLPESA